MRLEGVSSSALTQSSDLLQALVQLQHIQAKAEVVAKQPAIFYQHHLSRLETHETSRPFPLAHWHLQKQRPHPVQGLCMTMATPFNIILQDHPSIELGKSKIVEEHHITYNITIQSLRELGLRDSAVIASHLVANCGTAHWIGRQCLTLSSNTLFLTDPLLMKIRVSLIITDECADEIPLPKILTTDAAAADRIRGLGFH
ncbi:hypothetical protein HD553DRAFT_325362 [Filobasidium floriforme]|uniref:uncharacterized protein n=1 Tax=Filobasidium floriforme TaxID=5210 RepID=UPI001E8E09E7|nr:uncharacterized protein HD553DRAFT_325362 [Filobasidium floriforme]KAH8081928.1 hypothetical protein HD553DRAFT_325362 [Filobasidium floriforme]